MLEITLTFKFCDKLKENLSFRVRSLLTTTMFFFCRHVQTVALVTMQPIFDDIKIMLTALKSVCHCRLVRMVLTIRIWIIE